LSLAQDERHRDAFLESGVLEYLLSPTYATHSDRKVRRPVGKFWFYSQMLAATAVPATWTW